MRFDAQLAALTTPSRTPSASGPSPTDPAVSASRRRTSRRSSSAGYLVDSSVAPLFYEAHKGGPDFADAPLTPYYLAYDHATRPGSSQRARAAAVGGAQPPRAARLCRWPGPAHRAYTTSACCSKLGLATSSWLRPSYSSLDDMMRAGTPAGRESRVPLLNLLFHSSEAIVGGSPYNRTRGRARRLLRSAGSLPGVRDPRARRDAADVPRVPGSIHQRPCRHGDRTGGASARCGRCPVWRELTADR